MNLPSESIIIGHPHHQFDSISSTNNYALEMLSKSKPREGTAISTDFQSGGRGQIGKTWESEADKNILVSLIMYPTFIIPEQHFKLTMTIALAISDFIEHTIQKKASVKWPNDIYVGEKKIAGILIQNSLQNKKITTSIIGMGINVNQLDFNHAPNPTSLALLSNKGFKIEELLPKLFLCIERRWLQLKKKSFQLLNEHYHNKLYLKGIQRKFLVDSDKVISGKIKGVNEEGLLMIETDEGNRIFETRTISIKY